MNIIGDELVELIDGKKCLVSKNITHNLRPIKWMYREEPIEEFDSGWRVFCDEDTEEYINQSGNIVPMDYNTLANLNPRVVEIYNAPVGSDFEIINGMFIDINEQNVGLKFLEPFKAGTIIRVNDQDFEIIDYQDGYYKLKTGEEIRHPDINIIVAEETKNIFG